MDSTPSQTRESSESSSKHNYDNLIASYWRQHRKPATYLDDHDHGSRLTPLQSSTCPPLPPVPKSEKGYRKRNLVFPEGNVGGSSMAATALSSVAVVCEQYETEVFRGEHISRENSLPPLPKDAFVTQRPTASFVSSTLAKLSNMRRKRTNRNKNPTSQKHQTGQHQAAAQMDSLESSSDPNPPSSSDSLTSSHSHPAGSYGAGYDSLDSKGAQPGGSTGNQSIITNNSNSNSDNNSEIKTSPKRQRPIVPRIIIPDGTSINLSTPPSTPRQQYPLGPPIRLSQMTPWPYNFLQIKERLGMPTGSPRVLTKANRSAGGVEHGRKRSSGERIAPQQQQVRQDGNESMDTISYNEVPAQEPPLSQQQHQQQQGPSGVQHGRHIQESGETTAGTAGTDARTHEERGYLPEFGIMGLPMVYRAESLSSSEKYIWWGYDGHERGAGGIFSGAFWSRRFSTKAAVLNTLKHAATTSFGLLIIIAIALTALGKIKNRDQVSDSIPHSLDGMIMEAQVVVVKDINSLRNSKVATTRSGTITPGEQDALDQLEAIKLVETSRIPIWTKPIRKECFQKKCDLENFGKELFAFMNPESFGIALPENWPSLCNSCIEITRNQFVYKTTVRVLGDLQSCFSPTSEEDQNQLSTPPPSYPLPPPLPLSLQPSLSPSLITTPTTTTTTTLIPVASPKAIMRRHRIAKVPKDDQDLAKGKPHRPAHRPRRPHPRHPIASVSRPPTAPTSDQPPNEVNLRDVKLTQTSNHERILAPLQRRQAGHSSSDSSSPPPSMPSPFLSPSPSSSRVGLNLPPTHPDPASAPQLPYLIVDPATFDNLTRYDSRMVIQNMDFLRVQFRFVLCDD